MVVKERGISLDLQKLVALDRRLHKQHRWKEKVLSDLKRKRSSLKGEKEVEYPLRFLNEQDFLILHNVRVPDQNGFFQIDTLVLSEKYILILEVKNWYGTILFGENGQVTRTGDSGIEEGFPNPIPQAKLQKHRLQKWLHLHGLTHIPLEFFVVISFPSTIIKSISPKHPIPNKVIHNSQLFFKIQELDAVYPLQKLEISQLRRLSEQLMEEHTPITTAVLDQYDVSKEELIKGVICPTCSAVPMIRKREKWYCEKCNSVSTDAHLEAFNDYVLLIGNKITNRIAKEFLQIHSPYVTKRLLQHAKFKSVGSTKGRVYKLVYRK